MNTIITISREYGSGGREVGLLVAKKLNIPFYDKELITKTAESGEFSPDILREHEERADYSPSVFYQMRNIVSFYHQPLTTRIYLAQHNLIQKLAKEGPCVIIGRCSDAVLAGNCVSVFVHADLEARIARKIRLDGETSAEEMKKRILDIDKQRKRYYEFHTDRKWGDMKNYHLCIDSSAVTTELCADLIEQYVRNLGKGGMKDGLAKR